jgi:hypothetical protein
MGDHPKDCGYTPMVSGNGFFRGSGERDGEKKIGRFTKNLPILGL